MKTINIYKVFVVLLAVSFFCSCSKEDDVNANMSIDAVFLEDASYTTSNHDRKIEFARLGQLIRLQGSGFTGLKKIYINGYETYFNNALITDNNVWVTLHKDTPLASADPEVRNTIRLYKSDTNYYDYKFTIRSSAPSIDRISITLPMPGEKVTVYGSNLEETSSVLLPDGTVITDGIECDEDGEWYSFIMPASADTTIGGSIESEGANGKAKSPAYFCESRGMILNLDDIGALGVWDATYENNDLVQDPLNSGRKKCIPLLPERIQADGGLAAGTRSLMWFTTGSEADWATFECVSLTDNVEDVAIQFDIYCPEPWDLTGQLEFTLQNNLSGYGWGSTETKYTTDIENPTAVVWVPWMDHETGKYTEEYKTDSWETVTIPLSWVGKYQKGATFADVVKDRNAAEYKNFGCLLVNKDLEFSESIIYPATRWNQKVYIDNLRIVPCKKFSISDYED